MNLQPHLESDNFQLLPLEKEDFEPLFALASNPQVWSQHPNPNRYQRAEFDNFFQGALQSGGAFKVVRKGDRKLLGSTRFYDYNPEQKSVLIGYTFYGRDYWGQGVNAEVKALMLDYAFQFVERVLFHVGRDNQRSKRAMQKLGAKPLRELEVAYHGEQPKFNIEYEILKFNWPLD